MRVPHSRGDEEMGSVQEEDERECPLNDFMDEFADLLVIDDENCGLLP